MYIYLHKKATLNHSSRPLILVRILTSSINFKIDLIRPLKSDYNNYFQFDNYMTHSNGIIGTITSLAYR